MSEGYGELNPDSRRHQDFLDAIVDELDSESWMTTPELKDALAKHEDVTWKDSHIRSMLTYARPYLVDNGDIEIDEDPRGGNPTYLWRLPG